MCQDLNEKVVEENKTKKRKITTNFDADKREMGPDSFEN